MLISVNAAAQRLGKPRQWLDYKIKKDPPPAYVNIDENGKITINDEHKEYLKLEKELLSQPERKPKTKTLDDKTKKDSKRELNDIQDLAIKAKKADLEKKIAVAGTEKEKEKQAILETNKLKKDLVPFSLLAYFFSYKEKLDQDVLRRPHEIMPQLAAVILSCKDNNYHEAEKFLINELEIIIKNNTKELLDEIEKEGLRLNADH